MKRSEVIELVLMLMQAYPNAKVGERTCEVYEQALLDLDRDHARSATSRLIATSKWLPTIAEIRAAATDLRLGPGRTGGEAWADAITAVRVVGRYGVPTWSDPLLGEAMRMWGSWRDFCNSPEDDPGGRARFIELYEQLASRGRAAAVSGIALPAPKTAPRLVAAPAPARRDVSRVTSHVGAGPVAERSTSQPSASNREPKRATARPVSPFAGRKMSAEEIDAALGEAS
jgi:hypothetical protein